MNSNTNEVHEDEINSLKKLLRSLAGNFDRIDNSLLSRRSHSLSKDDIKIIKEYLVQNVDSAARKLSQHNYHFHRNRECAKGINIFSLGVNCYSRSFTVRWGFKPYAEEGEKSHPFDLAVHRLSTISDLIKKDFSGYFTEGSLSWKEGKKFPVNTELGINYNHDNSPEFKNDNFQLLKDRYSNRIDNFRNDVLSSECAVFVCTIWIDSRITNPELIIEKLNRLRREVARLKSNSHVVFISISSDPLSDKINRVICSSTIDGASFIREITPFNPYNAFSDYHKAGGFEMELRISNKLHKIISAYNS